MSRKRQNPDENPSRETWAFAVRALGEGPPTQIRMRRMIKMALRVYGLECVGIKLVKPAQPHLLPPAPVGAGR